MPDDHLSPFQIWKFLLRTGVKLYPDGFYKLSGVFGHSATFGRLKVSKKKMKKVTSRTGTLKRCFLNELAYFMCKERVSSPLRNSELVILGLTKLLNESMS